MLAGSAAPRRLDLVCAPEGDAFASRTDVRDVMFAGPHAAEAQFPRLFSSQGRQVGLSDQSQAVSSACLFIYRIGCRRASHVGFELGARACGKGSN